MTTRMTLATIALCFSVVASAYDDPAEKQSAEIKTVWGIFDGIILRDKPEPHADGRQTLSAAEAVQQVAERNGAVLARTTNGEGWVHPLALVQSRQIAEQCNSHNPKPNSLFIASKFTAPSDFQLALWHGTIQLPDRPGAKIELKPGNCIAIESPAPGDYAGPYKPFGHALDRTQANTLFIVNGQGKLIPLIPRKPINIIVRLAADAELELEGVKTVGTGQERRFQTPPIEVGKDFKYRLKATWKEKGQTQTVERSVPARAGETIEVDLRPNDVPQSDGSGTPQGNRSRVGEE